MTAPACRIALVVDEFPPVVGGIASYSRDVARFLGRRGDVVVFRKHAAPPIDLGPRVAEAVWTPDGVPSGFSHAIFNHMNLLSAPALRKCRVRGIRTFVSVYGADIGLRQGPRVWLRLARLFRRLNGVMAISRDTAAVFRRRYPFCPAPALLPPGLAGPPAAAPAESPDREVIAVGRLVARKGFDTLLQAMALIRASRPATTCTILGDGPQRGDLERLRDALGLGEAVRFLRGLEDAAVVCELRRHRLFCLLPRVLPNGDREGFGIVFLEAAGQGLPVVAGDSGGVADAVSDGVNGRLVDPERPAAAAAAMLELLGDEALRRRMAAASLSWAARFHWPNRDPARELAFLEHGDA